MGVKFYTTKLTTEGRDIRLTIWYISPAERFKPLLANFITDAHSVVLILDLTNSSTLNFLSKFPPLIRERAGDIPILLIGNKKDLEELREVSGEDAGTFVRHHGLMGYLEISAQRGDGCEEIFKLIGEKLYHHFKDLQERVSELH